MLQLTIRDWTTQMRQSTVTEELLQRLIRESQEIERQRRLAALKDQTETRRKPSFVIATPPKSYDRVAASHDS